MTRPEATYSEDGGAAVIDWDLAARSYFARGWTTTPLTFDDNRKPKRPFVDGWQHTQLDWENIEAQPWERADGIGIVLGPASGNLAVIDLDDVELANTVLELLRGGKREHYWVETGRKHGHLYLIEGTSSLPANLPIEWRGKKINIELKSRGQQVAAPPTPGYAPLWGETPVLAQEGVHGAWRAIARRLGLPVSPAGVPAGNFPQPWQETVPEGERNMALYVEAHKLREAGMPERTTLETMQARVQAAYGAGFGDREVQRVVRSAYRKGEVRVHVGWVRP